MGSGPIEAIHCLAYVACPKKPCQGGPQVRFRTSWRRGRARARSQAAVHARAGCGGRRSRSRARGRRAARTSREVEVTTPAHCAEDAGRGVRTFAPRASARCGGVGCPIDQVVSPRRRRHRDLEPRMARRRERRRRRRRRTRRVCRPPTTAGPTASRREGCATTRARCGGARSSKRRSGADIRPSSGGGPRVSVSERDTTPVGEPTSASRKFLVIAVPRRSLVLQRPARRVAGAST